MNTIHKLSWLALLLLLTSCGQKENPKAKEAAKQQERIRLLGILYGTPDNFDVVRNAESVQLRLIKDTNAPSLEKRFLDASEPVALEGETLRTMLSLMGDTETYWWPEENVMKMCAPIYGVRADFKGKDRVVSVVYCFECNILSVLGDEMDLMKINFDPGAQALLALMQSIFPENEALKRL